MKFKELRKILDKKEITPDEQMEGLTILGELTDQLNEIPVGDPAPPEDLPEVPELEDEKKDKKEKKDK